MFVPHNEIFARSKHILSVGHQDGQVSQTQRQNKQITKKYSNMINDSHHSLKLSGAQSPALISKNNYKDRSDYSNVNQPLYSPERPLSWNENKQYNLTQPKVPAYFVERESFLLPDQSVTNANIGMGLIPNAQMVATQIGNGLKLPSNLPVCFNSTRNY